MNDNTCRSCGRGSLHAEEEFTCDICGAFNNVDGSVEYDGSEEGMRDAQDRIDDYDEQYHDFS
jgi:ribosomal protein L37E